MKAKTFENLIRKVVREEIDYALRREIKTLKEDLREGISKKEPKSIFPPKKTMKEEIMGSSPIEKRPYIKQQFTSNAALNSILNETAMGDTSLGQSQLPASMEGSFGGEDAPMNTIGDMPIEAAPKQVVEAVTRDYSSLMKAINNKKKNK